MFPTAIAALRVNDGGTRYVVMIRLNTTRLSMESLRCSHLQGHGQKD